MSKLVIVDDFYRDFDAVLRRLARARFVVRNGYVGKVSTSRVGRIERAAARRLGGLLGGRIEWDWKAGAGTFRTLTHAEVVATGQQIAIHADSTRWACLIYLNREQDCQGGTAFYRHRATGLDGFDNVPRARQVAARLGLSWHALRVLIGLDCLDESKWQLVDRIAMKPNRALLYDGRRFHSHWLDLPRMKRSRLVRSTQSFFTHMVPELARPIWGKR